MVKYFFTMISLITFSSCAQEKLEGLYVGIEKVNYSQLGGKERQQVEKDSQNMNGEFFKISYLKIKDDSIFFDKESFTLVGQDTVVLGNDGIHRYFNGTYSQSNSNLTFDLQEVVVNYFERTLSRDKDGKLIVNKQQSKINGQLTQNGILINNVLFKKKAESKRLISESPELFKERQ